jgi:hypothetical protein
VSDANPEPTNPKSILPPVLRSGMACKTDTKAPQTCIFHKASGRAGSISPSRAAFESSSSIQKYTMT